MYINKFYFLLILTFFFLGSLSGPKDLPGLAHFCEHMLFLGTKKYPVENEFTQFLSKHCGSYNAYTLNDHTCFYFSIQAESFAPALDRSEIVLFCCNAVFISDKPIIYISDLLNFSWNHYSLLVPLKEKFVLSIQSMKEILLLILGVYRRWTKMLRIQITLSIILQQVNKVIGVSNQFHNNINNK